MKILITGGKGFLGTYIFRELSGSGHQVTSVDWEEGDLRNPSVISKHLWWHRPDLVIHLAAKVGRLFGEDNIIETIIDNAGITANIAKACGENGVRVAYASTSEVYGDFGVDIAYESGLCTGILPHNIYGLSKRWGEEVLKLYAPNNLICFRFSMPIGPGHPPGFGRAALTNFIWNAMKQKPIIVHKDSERSWCWVGDTARAVRMIIESDQSGAWNVGRDDNKLTMEEVAIRVCDMVGSPKTLIQLVDPPSRQTVIKRLSTEKLWSLGWKPEVEFDEMLQRIYLWLVENERTFDSEAKCLK